MKTFSDYIDIVEGIAKEIYKKQVEKMDIPENVELQLEGPNVIFKSKLLQFRISSMKFLTESDHKEYKNFLGESGIIFDVFHKAEKSYEDEVEEIREKIEKSLKVIKGLYESNCFLERGSYGLILG